jgi:hypothetical protein
MAGARWGAKGGYYAVPVCLHVQLIARLLYQRSGRARRAVEGQLRTLSYAHGVLAVALMWVLQPGNGSLPRLCGAPGAPAASYVLQAVPALVLWDLGLAPSRDLRRVLLLTMHHVGLFIALHFQHEPEQAWRDSAMFGWLWAVHSFGLFALIKRTLVELVSGKACTGQRSVRRSLYSPFPTTVIRFDSTSSYWY